eukprot:9034481-Pyramimonas_sp.AAC.1
MLRAPQLARDLEMHGRGISGGRLRLRLRLRASSGFRRVRRLARWCLHLSVPWQTLPRLTIVDCCARRCALPAWSASHISRPPFRSICVGSISR